MLGAPFTRAGVSGRKSPPNAAERRRKLAELEQRKVSSVQNIHSLEYEPAAFINSFWRDFHQSILRGTERSSSMVKMWGLLLFAALLFSGRSAFADKRVNLVVALDLSASVSTAAGPDNKTAFDNDLAAVSHLSRRSLRVLMSALLASQIGASANLTCCSRRSSMQTKVTSKNALQPPGDSYLKLGRSAAQRCCPTRNRPTYLDR